MKERLQKFYNNCPLDKCPLKEKRICIAYKNGESRLVFDPLSEPVGKRLYREARERLQSIEGCLEELVEKAAEREARELELV